MAPILQRLRESDFNVESTYHADAILYHDFFEAIEELDRIIDGISIPIVELIRGGGGEAQVTQRLRGDLHEIEWQKRTFHVEKKINNRTTLSESHEVDHVKVCANGTIALEIEWNNKDPFFDRDLENFNRLHADGAISVGMIVTRGETFQNGIQARIREFARSRRIGSFGSLAQFGNEPTTRQRNAVERYMESNACSFGEAWATCFTRDKFGSATTHWLKLKSRLDRGVGSPCPIVGIGIPLSRITG